jgi:hypothetical protein
MADFRESRFGRVALYIAGLEPLIIWGCAMSLYTFHASAPEWLARGLRLVYTVGIFSLILAIVGLRRDSTPRSAALAFIICLLNLIVCVIPIVR